MEDRIVLLRRPDIEPDPPEAMERLELRPGDMRVIVPEHPSPQRRRIGDRHREEDKGCEGAGARPDGLRRP
jgi:hypothetical protein